jgi:hypothetical protein
LGSREKTKEKVLPSNPLGEPGCNKSRTSFLEALPFSFIIGNLWKISAPECEQQFFQRSILQNRSLFKKLQAVP